MKKKIAVITGSRADYDLLYKTLNLIKQSNKLKLQLYVTGAHLKKQYGLTVNQIYKDGFHVTAKINILNKINDSLSVATSISLGINLFSKSFYKNVPHLILVLGDRYETFSAVIAAANLKIPIAHISGGEASEANIDESIRHSITKFSHFHFVANRFYKKKIIQMGENPKSVFNVGGLGMDNIKNNIFLNKTQISKELNFHFKNKNIILTYHPVTYLSKEKNCQELKIILSAIDKFSECGLIITYPNADLYNLNIIKILKNYIKTNKNAKLYKFLGRQKYLSCMKEVDLIIGNSSSAITEAPFLKVPSIDVGIRQLGRLKAKSVIECKCSKKEIIKNIKKSFSSKFRNSIMKQQTFYGNGNSAEKILKVLERKNNKDLLIKKFYYI